MDFFLFLGDGKFVRKLYIMKFSDSQKEIAPCIVSKVRYALKIKSEKPNNKKPCSQEYWKRTVFEVAEKFGIKENNRIQNAISLFADLISK